MTNQEAYEELCDKAEKYDKLVEAIKDIKAEIEKITPKVVHDSNEMEIYNVRKYDIEIIDKHTKELM